MSRRSISADCGAENEGDAIADDPLDPVIGAMIRCYVAQPKIAWPYLAMRFGAIAFLVGALFAPA